MVRGTVYWGGNICLVGDGSRYTRWRQERLCNHSYMGTGSSEEMPRKKVGLLNRG